MKKITLGALIVLAGLFVLRAPAHAAAPTNTVLDTEDAAVAKQSLDVLQAVLNQVKAKIEAQGGAVVENASEISASLNSISANLQTMHGTLASIGGNSAFAENAPASPLSLNSPESANVLTPATGELVPAFSPNEGIAAVTTHFSVGKFVWPSVVAVVIFLSVWLLRFKNEDNELALAEFPPARNFSETTVDDFSAPRQAPRPPARFESKNEIKIDSRRAASWD